jgi:ABC-2 type transport system permease protein
MTTHTIGDSSVLLGRSLRHIFRSADTIITTAITPIAIMLLFVYVFGGAIDTGDEVYVNYVLPGVLLIAIASGIAYTAVRLFTDLQSGIFERFHSMPVARSSVLWAHVLTSLVANGITVVIIIGVGLLMGFRTSASFLDWLAVAGILALFTLALTWIAIVAGLSAKSVDGAAGPTPCPDRSASSPKISRLRPSSALSRTSSPSARSAVTSGWPWPGASGSSSPPTCSR